MVLVPPGFDQVYIQEQTKKIFSCHECIQNHDLHRLQEKIERCKLCPSLVYSRQLYTYGRPTFGYGNPKSPIFIIAQSPGWRGCGTTGIPFEPKSRTGRIYEDILKKAKLTFESIWTTNLVKCCPEGSDSPTAKQAINCAPFLLREIKYINPCVLIAVGSYARHFLTKSKIFDKKCFFVKHPGYYLRKQSGLEEYIKYFVEILEEAKSFSRKQCELGEFI